MKILTSIVTVGLLFLSLAARADIAVVVAPGVPLEDISVEQLERLYLHRANRYPNRVKLVPVDQPTGSDIRIRFTQKVLWKNEIELAEYWSRRMFSGKGRPPRQYRDDTAVIDAVLEKPGTLGYVDGDSVDERVKVLLRLP